MKARIRFAMDICIEGDDMTDIRRQWEGTPLDELCAKGDFVEIETVEDAGTYKDLTEEFDKEY